MLALEVSWVDTHLGSSVHLGSIGQHLLLHLIHIHLDIKLHVQRHMRAVEEDDLGPVALLAKGLPRLLLVFHGSVLLKEHLPAVDLVHLFSIK